MLDSLAPDQSCVLDLPPIVPDDWSTWWEYWENRREVDVRGDTKAKRGRWVGLEIYRSETYNPDEWKYHGKYLDARTLFPKMFENIARIPARIDVIRAVTSYTSFAPHSDWRGPAISLRSMVWDENPEPTFYYQVGEKKVYQSLPNESNTWVYRDHGYKHGSDYDPRYQKILLMYQGQWNWDGLARLVQVSRQRFQSQL